MRVLLTRDSVCMGDDVRAPHESAWDVADNAPLSDLLDQAARPLLGLPSACWVLHLGYNRSNGEPLAVTAPQWPTPRPLPTAAAATEAATETAARLGADSGRLELFWAYHPQADPEALVLQLAARPQPPVPGPTPPPR